jgi:hypothetical protein
LLFAVVQVAQATLPFGFGQTAMVIDPRTGRFTSPYKQILRVRLLLGHAESLQVCLSAPAAGKALNFFRLWLVGNSSPASLCV